MLLSKNDLIEQAVCGFNDVEVEGFKGKIRFKDMSGKDRDEYMSNLAHCEKVEIEDQKTGAMRKVPNIYKGMKAEVVALVIIGEDGKPYFSKDEAGALKADKLESLFDQAVALNKLSEEAEEEAEKN